MPDPAEPLLEVRQLGDVPYQDGLDIQAKLVEKRREGSIPDQLLLLEHPHVLTLGTSSSPDHLLLSEEERSRLGLEVVEVGRGGDVTYHGPGQLVGYPILSLSPDRKDLHRYLRDLEDVLLRTVATFGITAHREEGMTGIWVPEGKLAAIGVRVSSRWITSHGFALNVNPDLSYFSSIIPCGISNRSVASMAHVLRRPIQVQDVVEPLVESFERVFSRKAVVV